MDLQKDLLDGLKDIGPGIFGMLSSLMPKEDKSKDSQDPTGIINGILKSIPTDTIKDLIGKVNSPETFKGFVEKFVPELGGLSMEDLSDILQDIFEDAVEPAEDKQEQAPKGREESVLNGREPSLKEMETAINNLADTPIGTLDYLQSLSPDSYKRLQDALDNGTVKVRAKSFDVPKAETEKPYIAPRPAPIKREPVKPKLDEDEWASVMDAEGVTSSKGE